MASAVDSRLDIPGPAYLRPGVRGMYQVGGHRREIGRKNRWFTGEAARPPPIHVLRSSALSPSVGSIDELGKRGHRERGMIGVEASISDRFRLSDGVFIGGAR